MSATTEADDRVQVGPTDLEARVEALTIANRTLARRNTDLAAKTLQAEGFFNILAERAYLGCPPPIASLEDCARYFHDTAKFIPDLQPFGPAPVKA